MGNLYGYGPVAGPITPDLPLATPSANGRIRVRMGEDALAAHRAGRVRVTEVRASDFIGPDSGANAHLGDRVIPRILAGKKVRAFAALDQPHSWTYVPDVARTIAVLGTDERSWGRAWHVPTNQALSQREACASIAAVAGVPMPAVGTLSSRTIRAVGVAVPLIRALGQQLYQFDRPFVIDASETTATFGIEPTPWDDCVRATVAAYGSDRVSAPDA
jgi:nucleoside-diphosphate-sugar epimerase